MFLGSSDFVQILPACGENTNKLQIVFATYTVSNSNGNMKGLDERKNPCKKLMFQ